jgi:hypothetical protein
MGFNGDNADSNGGKGIVRDMRRIRAGSAMTAAELREFIRQFKGKSPQEVLGTVAQSGLSRAVGLATIGCVALVAVFTILPYAWGKVLPVESKPERKPTAAPAAPAAAASEPRPAASPQTATAAPSPAVNAGQDLLEKLGEGDAKTSDPRSNPLEDSADDLLKDLK